MTADTTRCPLCSRRSPDRADGLAYVIHTLTERAPLLSTGKEDRSVVVVAVDGCIELEEGVRDRLTVRGVQRAKDLQYRS